MTVLLEQALAEVKKLSDPEQDTIARLILDELADETRWDAAFAKSQAQLSNLASKARKDIQAGRVTNKGMDEL